MKINYKGYQVLVLVCLIFVWSACETGVEGNAKNTDNLTSETASEDYETSKENYVSDGAESEISDDASIDEKTTQPSSNTPKEEAKTEVKNDATTTAPDDKNATASTADFFKDADKFLAKNVSNGKVNYKGIAANKAELNDLVATIGKMNVDKKSQNEYKAFWINAYNLLTIKGIADNYPIKQPEDVKGFFDKISYTAAGEKVTLNDIENKKIRAKLKDARIHFVLVCGAKSCPPIINKAYTPDNVNALLETQTKKAVNADYFVTVDKASKTAKVSMIMKWYKEDFVKGGQDEIAFLNKYRNDKIPTDYSIKYQEYNWDINKQ